MKISALESDSQKLRSDWEKVGQDLTNAAKKINKETPN